MKREQAVRLSVISSVLIIFGLIFLFTSVKFGTGLANQWLNNTSFGIANTAEYETVAITYINNFVIIGALLFGAGLLIGFFTYIIFLLFGKSEKDKEAVAEERIE